MLAEQALQVLEESDQLVSAEAVLAALDRLGQEITHALGRCNPLLLVVMREVPGYSWASLEPGSISTSWK